MSGSLAFVPRFITAWAFAGTLTLLLLARGLRLGHVPAYVVALALAFGARGMARGSVAAWRFTLGLVALVGLLSAASFVLNATALLLGHEPYLDSPATFLVVVINSLFTLLPALIVAYLCWRARPQFRPLVTGTQVGAT